MNTGLFHRSTHKGHTAMDLAPFIRDIADFPKAGITFKDITPLLKHPDALDQAINQMADPYRQMEIDYVAGIESRGFIFGVPLARQLGAGFIPVRKFGKLPAQTIDMPYDLEYGTDHISIHTDAIEPGKKVLLADDLLATGGTMEAAIKLIEKAGGQIIGISFLVELGFLNGRKRLNGLPIESVILF